MPLFIDKHQSPTRASPERVAELHERDVALGPEFGVRWLSYHVDLVSVHSVDGHVVQYRTFCIAEAPSAEAVQACHMKAHETQANEIIAIQPWQVEQYLRGQAELDPDKIWDAAGRTPPAFTQRQVEILRLIAAGRTNNEIATILCLSPHTVARHVANILDRAGLSNRAEAAAHAQRIGLSSSRRS